MHKLALGAGHGFNTPGKRCPIELDKKGTREWWLNDRIADRVESRLAAYADISVLRVDDSDDGADDIALESRISRVNSWRPDFYLSIHHNGTDKIFNGGGIVSYCYTKGSKASFQWRDELYDALIAHTGLKGNRSEPKATANYYVTRKSNCPAVLLELGFMTSRVDCPIILTEEFADQCADAIVEVIVRKWKLERKKEGTCTLTLSGVPQNEADELTREMQGRGYGVDVTAPQSAAVDSYPDEGEAVDGTYPLTMKIEGMPVILARNIVPFSPNASLSKWGNTISGGFSASKQPCSILVQDGVAGCKYACHYWYGCPESVMYRLTDGTVGIARVKTTDELPKNLRWAVGGLGLLDNYAPTTEGFCKLTANGKTEDFSDVLRNANHTVLGYKAGLFHLIYCKSMTAAQVNTFAKNAGLELAVMLDGGHVAAINGDADYAKINTAQKQYYAIQGE